jgi:hypothetical protein
LSGAWLCDPTIAYLVLDLARKALVIGERDLLKLYKGSEKNIVRIINECDVKGARRLLKINKDFYLKIFQSIYGGNSGRDKVAFNTFYVGANKVLDNPNDIAGNWSFDNPSQSYPARRFSAHYDSFAKKIAA